MPHEKQKEKNIVGVQKDNIRELVPNISYGEFLLKEDIRNYTHLPHTKQYHKEKYFSYYSYEFAEIDMIVWVQKNIIDSIRLTKECFFCGENIIKMDFDYFLKKYGVKPNDKETLYTLVNGRGQNQIVYDFDKLGLQIWVWRGKIRTVIVY